ncbi:hypothetical protein ACQV2S_08680 [Facklamia sp. P13064]|uniref:hypothetical protein n=1 Tax=unclassified Facklamia TaxID=2622293 RepID=UPI003D16FD5A
MAIKKTYEHSVIEEHQSMLYLNSINIQDNIKAHKIHNEIDFIDSLPNIESLDISKYKKSVLNCQVNTLLIRNKFDYLSWRKNKDFSEISLIPIKMQMHNFSKAKISSEFFKKLCNSTTEVLLKDILFYISDTLSLNVIYLKGMIDGYKCVFLPLKNINYIIIGDKVGPFHFYYLLHEVSHVIVNFLLIKMNLIFSIEEEEYWAHFFESAFINSYFNSEKENYIGFTQALLEENKAITEFQIELFKYPLKYSSLEDKKII